MLGAEGLEVETRVCDVSDARFPAGERRLIQQPTGLRYTLVNGLVTFVENECTGALPGRLLRTHQMVG